jgi:hypothetical protein
MVKKARSIADFLPKGTVLPEVASFGTGEVAEILDVPIWRLQKFLDSPSYHLSPEGRLGHGRGSRRMFSTEDIYRIAIAAQMVGDGFAAPFVGSILERFDDYDFHPGHDAEGNEIEPFALFGLRRNSKGTAELKFYGRRPVLGEKDSPYYVFAVASVVAEINKRIAKRKTPQE